jgi:hypothetical protein
MAEILLVNPRYRKGARKMARHRRMPTALKKYWATHRRNPSRRHHKRHRHHYRKNPFGNASSVGKNVIEGGAIGAVGAIANDFAFTYTQQYLPASITSVGYGVAAVKLLYAVLIGMFGGKVWAGKGTDLAVGAATVAIHDFAVSNLQGAGINLSGLGGIGAYMSYGPSVGSRTMGNTSQGRSVVRQLQRTTTGMGRVGGLGAYMSRTGPRVPQRGMGAYMSGVGDTTFANGIPTG